MTEPKGIYIAANPTVYRNESIEYLSAVGNCNCRFENCVFENNSTNCGDIPGVIIIKSSIFEFTVAKVKVESLNPSEYGDYDGIGVHLWELGLITVPKDDGTADLEESPFNVLVCDETPEN